MVYSNRENLVYKLLVTHGSKKIDNMCQLFKVYKT